MNLEIIIPTWNRSEYLERTLSQFANSPFKNVKITIIDNASSDNTPEVCDKYKDIFPNFKIIRNNKNIGLSANILRCYEIAKEEYMWLVGDNDNYDFSDCSEVISAIEKSEFDLIFVQGNDKTNLKKTTIHELYEAGHGNDIIGLMGTISAYILKTELFTSECLQEGYDIAGYLYPQLAFMKKACDENFSAYISSKKIRIPDKNPNVSYNTLELVDGWISSTLILEKKYANELVKYYLGHKLLYSILGAIIAVKARNLKYRKTLNHLIISLIKSKGFIIGIIYAILMLCTSLIPHKASKYILNKYNEKNGFDE